jgi:hypothetical protein
VSYRIPRLAALAAVCDGFNEPSLPPPTQLVLQSTPLRPKSLLSVALKFVADPAGTVVGVCERVTPIAVWTIVTRVLALFVGSAIETALIVTGPPEGTTAGDVYLVP